jgi:hypothetical protein
MLREEIWIGDRELDLSGRHVVDPEEAVVVGPNLAVGAGDGDTSILQVRTVVGIEDTAGDGAGSA